MINFPNRFVGVLFRWLTNICIKHTRYSCLNFHHNLTHYKQSTRISILSWTYWYTLDSNALALSSYTPPCSFMNPEPPKKGGSTQALKLQEVYICAAWFPWRSTSCEYTDLTLKDSIQEITTCHAVNWVDDSAEAGTLQMIWNCFLYFTLASKSHHPCCIYLSHREDFVENVWLPCGFFLLLLFFNQQGSLKKKICWNVILVFTVYGSKFQLILWLFIVLFHLDKSLATCICHITIWHTPARLYLALNLSSSLSYDVSWDCFFSSFLLSSLCFSFCSAVWETPSNHQYNHHLFVQPSQSRRDNCLFQLGFLDPAVCLNNLSQICNAQFISLLIKWKCFSLASFDVNSCVLSAARLLIMLNKAPDKGQMDTTLSLPFSPNSHNW